AVHCAFSYTESRQTGRTLLISFPNPPHGEGAILLSRIGNEKKFIPEPRPEIDGGAIASWSVFATVWPGRVAVAGHRSRRLRAWVFAACFNPRSSNSRTSLRTG